MSDVADVVVAGGGIGGASLACALASASSARIRSTIAGLLVGGLDGVPQADVFAGEGDVFFLLFHQGGGRARVYCRALPC
jgi:glycine/D-amino acid oxidase-like deaminating enzyme